MLGCPQSYLIGMLPVFHKVENIFVVYFKYVGTIELPPKADSRYTNFTPLDRRAPRGMLFRSEWPELLFRAMVCAAVHLMIYMFSFRFLS